MKDFKVISSEVELCNDLIAHFSSRSLG